MLHFFIIYPWRYKISLISIGLKSTERNFIIPFNFVLFILLIVKSFEMLPKPSLLLWIDIFLWQEQIRNCRFHYSEESIQIFSWLCRINRIFLASAVNVVSSNPCVGLSPEVKISLFYYQFAQMSSYKLQK